MDYFILFKIKDLKNYILVNLRLYILGYFIKLIYLINFILIWLKYDKLT